MTKPNSATSAKLRDISAPISHKLVTKNAKKSAVITNVKVDQFSDKPDAKVAKSIDLVREPSSQITAVDALFGSKSRIKLLRLFLNNPSRAFYVREISRATDEQINSVRRELANLVTVGIIRAEDTDHKLYYEANIASPIFAPLKTIFEDGDAIASDTKVSTKDFAKKFLSTGDVRVVIFAGKLVYGSVSELDLLIAGDRISPIKLKNVVKSLEKEAGSTLNFANLSFNDFYYRLSVKDKFVADLLSAKHSVVLDTDDILREFTDEDNVNSTTD